MYLPILYGRHGDVLEPYPELPWVAATGTGELYTSVEELYAYDQALYGDSLLSQTTLAEAFRPYHLDDGSVAGDLLGDQGLGWQIISVRGTRSVWHAGGGFGVDAALYRFPDRQLTVISLRNSEDGVERHLSMLRRIIPIYFAHQNARG